MPPVACERLPASALERFAGTSPHSMRHFLILHAYEYVTDARQQFESYFTFYNALRPHSSLGGQTPDMAYFGNSEMKKAA